MPSISDTDIIKGNPIELYGLTFYPITMEHYELWQACKGVLTIRMATLPALYAAKPYIAALYAHDVDAKQESDKNGTQWSSWTAKLAAIMNLAMRLPLNFKPFIFSHRPDKDNDLTNVVIQNGETRMTLPPHKFREIRELLAIQNGEELPNEAENPELVQAQNDIAASKSSRLKYDFKTLVASVANQANVRQEDVMGWTIQTFTAKQAAINRDKHYMLNGIAEANGAKWKNGNPTPSWCFDRDESQDGGFMSETDMLGKLGKAGTIKKG